MRHWIAALLVAVGLSALAQEGEELMPRIDLPGERAVPKKLAITKGQMDRWELTSDDRKTLEDKVGELNKQRAELLGQLDQARKRLEEAEEAVHQAVERLRAQQDELHATIKPMLPPDKRETFDLRVDLQPIIDWLNLSESQANDLVRARRELINEYGGPDDHPAARIRKAATEDVSAENRDQYKELVKKYMEFQGKWLTKVRDILNEEQKKTWNTRYRRTMYTIPGGSF